jgi:predicted nucleic-acid-binding protein
VIGLDTNVLLRATLKDDAVQTPIAERIILGLTPEKPGYVNLVVLLEFIWTLRKRGYANSHIVHAVEAMLGSQTFVLESRSIVNAAIQATTAGSLSLSDAMIGFLNEVANAAPTMTFDRRAASNSLFQFIE